MLFDVPARRFRYIYMLSLNQLAHYTTTIVCPLGRIMHLGLQVAAVTVSGSLTWGPIGVTELVLLRCCYVAGAHMNVQYIFHCMSV